MELLTVCAIISIMVAASVSLVSKGFQANQLDTNVTMLSGMFEEAREAAISGNTFVWVAFTPNPSTSTRAGGISAVIFESQDGTDSLANFSNGTTASPIAISTANNLLQLTPVQALPGTQLTSSGALSFTNLPSLTPASASLQGSMGLTLNAGGKTVTFTQAVMFAPDGEARISTWSNAIEFGIQSSINSQSPNVAVMRLARLTGRLTVYRP